MDEDKRNRILIVDDESFNLKTLAKILNKEYIVYMEKSGVNAIESAEAYLPDIILLDIMMPDMDGYAVLKELKAHERTKDIPVIFITGLSSAESVAAGIKAGAVDYISKPFSPISVLNRVEKHLPIK